MSYQVQVLCDGHGCDKEFDVPADSQPVMEQHLLDAGWDVPTSDTHYCYECKELEEEGSK